MCKAIIASASDVEFHSQLTFEGVPFKSITSMSAEFWSYKHSQTTDNNQVTSAYADYIK